MILGLLLGEFDLAWKVGLFFELFWLDQFPAGTYLPSSGQAGACLALGALVYGHAHSPAAALLACLFGCVAGELLTVAENRLRLGNDHYHRLLMLWSMAPKRGVPPEWLLWRAVTRQAVVLGLVFAVLAGAAGFLFRTIIEQRWLDVDDLGLAWWQVWLVASMGGVLGLRVRAVYKVAAVGVAIVLFFAWKTHSAPLGG